MIVSPVVVALTKNLSDDGRTIDLLRAFFPPRNCFGSYADVMRELIAAPSESQPLPPKIGPVYSLHLLQMRCVCKFHVKCDEASSADTL